MEQLIRDLYSKANQGSPDKIQTIQRQIQHLQREKSAWQKGLDFLDDNDPNIRFYGALTLIVKINADWDNDGMGNDPVMQETLLQTLVSHYVRLALAADTSFVMQKLSSTLSVLYQRLASTWEQPVRHVLACLLYHQYFRPDQAPPLEDVLIYASQAFPRHTSAAVLFAATLAEDLTDRTGQSSGDVLRRLSQNCRDCFQFFDFILQQSMPDLLLKNDDNTSFEEALDLTELVIQAVPQWQALLSTQALHTTVEDAKATADLVSQVLLKVFDLYDHVLLRTTVLQTLIAVQQSSPRSLIRADPAFPQSFLARHTVRQSLQNLKDGDFDHGDIILVDLLEAIMTHVDCTSPAYLRSERLAGVLQSLQMLLRCEGAAAVEDEVCQVVLEIINQLVDGHTDWNEDVNNQFFHEYVRQACEACFAKATMPSTEMSTATQTWDAEDRSKFSAFRFEVQDFLLASYAVLGPALPEAIIQNLRQSVEPPNWPAYEVSIFCLRAFADSMSDDPELFSPYVEAVLNSSYFEAVLQYQVVPDQARKSSIMFISEITSFLSKHPNLMQILNFLFSSLHLPAAAASASQAIYTLCYEQRLSLTGALADFMASLGTITSIEPLDRHRVYGGVAAIIQALPTEQAKVNPIRQLIAIMTALATDLNSVDADEQTVLSRATDILRSMAAIGRGLRVPNDVALEADHPQTADHDFWTTGAGSEVQRQVLELYRHVMSQVSNVKDGSVVEASSDFLRSGLTEEHPSPFRFTAEVSTNLIAQQIRLDSANIDAVLGCASCLLASTGREEMSTSLPILLLPMVKNLRQLMDDHQRTGLVGSSSFPSAALDMFSRMLPKWINSLMALEEGKYALALIIDIAEIVIVEPDTLPRRSAASFFSSLVEASKAQKNLSPPSRMEIDNLMQLRSPRIVSLLLRLVAGECARSELEAISDPIRRYVSFHPMAFKSIGKEVMKAANGLLSDQAFATTTEERRSKFLNQLELLRGHKKTNDVIKEFWISCRGAGFNYVV